MDAPIILVAACLLAAPASGAARVAADGPSTSTSMPTRRPPGVPKNAWTFLEGQRVAATLELARSFVACVRQRGVPATSPRVVGKAVYLMLPPGFSRTSPRVKLAQKACDPILRRAKWAGK